jgi:molybdopterin-synthase adenylyltransferase
MLSMQELERYKRQIAIYCFGHDAQEKLKHTSVFIAGLGGLGCPAAVYLAAAGIGKLRIVDSEKVELSNLNRQILHWTQDIGDTKAESGLKKLAQLNTEIKIETIRETITPDNISDLVGDSDLILDATDNFEVRYILNQTAVQKRVPLCHGAVRGFEGQAMTVIPGKTACIMCLYYVTDMKEISPVLGTTPGIIACIEATEAIKYITGIGQLLTNRLLIYDGLNMQFHEIPVSRNPHCQHCGER